MKVHAAPRQPTHKETISCAASSPCCPKWNPLPTAAPETVDRSITSLFNRARGCFCCWSFGPHSSPLRYNTNSLFTARFVYDFSINSNFLLSSSLVWLSAPRGRSNVDRSWSRSGPFSRHKMFGRVLFYSLISSSLVELHFIWRKIEKCQLSRFPPSPPDHVPLG